MSIGKARLNIKFGNYDYYSIMHYGIDALGVHASNKELEERADKGKSFSAGDIAVIKKIYCGKKRHHGDWHRSCDPKRCTDTQCGCGACGSLHGGVNCGYEGMHGHWSCCMIESRSSDCDSVHTGFWHAKCGGKPCTDKLCYCNNCGGGCTYVGMQAHWSCCNSTDRHSHSCKVALQLMFGYD